MLQIPQQSSSRVLGSTPPTATMCTKVGIWSVDLSNAQVWLVKPIQQRQGHIQNGSSIDLSRMEQMNLRCFDICETKAPLPLITAIIYLQLTTIIYNFSDGAGSCNCKILDTKPSQGTAGPLRVWQCHMQDKAQSPFSEGRRGCVVLGKGW